MSKTKKLIVSVVLVVSILFAVAVPAFAAEPADGDPSYFVLRYAADQLDFTFCNLTEDSCRVFSKTKDGIFVTFFSSDDALGYSSIQAVGGTPYKKFIYSDGSFIPFSESESSSIFLYLRDLLYSEYSLKFPGAEHESSVSISDNTSSMHYSLQNLVFSRDLNGVWETIKALLPILLPAIVLFLAFRKGWSFLKGETATA